MSTLFSGGGYYVYNNLCCKLAPCCALHLFCCLKQILAFSDSEVLDTTSAARILNLSSLSTGVLEQMELWRFPGLPGIPLQLVRCRVSILRDFSFYDLLVTFLKACAVSVCSVGFYVSDPRRFEDNLDSRKLKSVLPGLLQIEIMLPNFL